MSISRVKNIDNESKFLVSGFVRESKINNTIPIMIEYLIMIYYWIEEKFTISGDGITLDETQKIAKTKNNFYGTYNTIYCNNVIDLNDTSIIKYEWTFKIINTADLITYWPYKNPIIIGIDSSKNNKYFINNNFGQINVNRNKFYSITSNGTICNNSNYQFCAIQYHELYDIWNNNDIIKIIFDVKQKSIFYQRNNQKIKIFGTNVYGQKSDIKYNLAISMAKSTNEPNKEIKIIKFKVFYQNKQ